MEPYTSYNARKTIQSFKYVHQMFNRFFYLLLRDFSWSINCSNPILTVLHVEITNFHGKVLEQKHQAADRINFIHNNPKSMHYFEVNKVYIYLTCRLWATDLGSA